MFEKYNEKARRAVFFARYEVAQLGGDAIEPEHLLLGLLREDKFLLARLLHERDKPVREAIRRQIAEHSSESKKISETVEIPLSNEAKNVLKYAAEESRGMLHKHIGTEHLLVGLLRADASFAAGVLREHGVEYEAAVREVLKQMYGE